MSNAWSFDTPDQSRVLSQIKEWACTIGSLRKSDAALVVDKGGNALHVDREAPVDVVYIPPRNPASASLSESLKVLGGVDAAAYEFTDSPRVAQQAAALLGAAGVELGQLES